MLIFFRLFGCCVVRNYCSLSVSLQCSYSADCFGNEAATTALQLLIIAPVDGSQNKLSSAPKYVNGCYYTSQGRIPAPDFVLRPCIGIFQYFTSSKTHTPGHREGCALPVEDRKTWFYADATELLWDYLDSANQTRARYLWHPSFCSRGFAPTKHT